MEMRAQIVEKLAAWVETQHRVKALVLIGSQVREEGRVSDADAESDWDFQLLTSDLIFWEKSDWVDQLGLGSPLAYCCRPTFGGVNKVTFILPGRIEVDLVVLASNQLAGARVAVALGLHRRAVGVRASLGYLAVVIRPGYQFLKGEETFGRLYQRVVAEVTDPRMADAEAVQLAEGFACDLVWQRRKLARGELLAAQRMLHQGLAETNFQLAHELRLRRGEVSFPEARRIEMVETSEQLNALGVSARRDRDELRVASEKAWQTLGGLMTQLVPGWQAPDLGA